MDYWVERANSLLNKSMLRPFLNPYHEPVQIDLEIKNSKTLEQQLYSKEAYATNILKNKKHF